MNTEKSTCAVCGGAIGPNEIVFGEMTAEGAKYHQDCIPSEMKPHVIGEVRPADED